jgi:hypothetical protein
MVVRHMVTYASFVCRTTKSAKAGMSSNHRSAPIIKVIKVIKVKSAPIISLEALLDLPLYQIW